MTLPPNRSTTRANPAGAASPAVDGLVIDGETLTCAQIRRVAVAPLPLIVAQPALARAQAGAQFAQRVRGERPVYGYATGVGANATTTVPDRDGAATGLLLSHLTAAGPPRSPGRVRAMIAVRVNQLAAGGSGVGPGLLEQLAAIASLDDLPAVREHVGIGDGDLAALAALGVAVAARRGPPLSAEEVLPLLSSNAAVLADAALAAGALDESVRASVVVTALSCAALRGNPEAFDPAVERVTPFPGAVRVCRWLRALTAGGPPPARLQDPLHLRAVPQSAGPALDAVAALEQVVERMANAASENPVMLPASPSGPGALAHHGGFHAGYLVLALDAANLAVARSATLSGRRLGALVDPARTGLPAFLGDGRPGANGLMLVEYVAVQALAELRAAAAPAALQTASVSLGIEDDATFAPLAASQSERVAQAYRRLLACELVAARRALSLAGRPLPPGLEAVSAIVGVLDPDPGDRDLSGDVELAQSLLGELARTLPLEDGGLPAGAMSVEGGPISDLS